MSDAARNLSEMSDDEIVNMDPSTLQAAEPANEQANESESGYESGSESQEQAEAGSVRGDMEEDASQHAEQDSEQRSEESEQLASGEDSEYEAPDFSDIYYKSGKGESAEEVDADEAQKIAAEYNESADAEAENVDYKEIYDMIFSQPFKAAGKEVRVRDPQDVISLMQKGVDYSRKMEQMKPHMKIIKALEKNDLLDTDKVNFLVDLVSRKDPGAIQKFLKDNEIDPLDLSIEEDSEYRPQNHTPNDAEMALDSVLDSIRDTEQFPRTVEIITDKWDGDSKREIIKDPSVISVINGHVGLGIYDQIMNIVDQERMFGRLQNMSDLDAYKAVGSAIKAQGGFEPYLKQRTQTGNTSQVPGSSSRNNQRDEQLRKRKKAAGSTRSSGGKSKEVTNFLSSLSDDEIEKMGPSVF